MAETWLEAIAEQRDAILESLGHRAHQDDVADGLLSEPDAPTCDWYALCENPADGVVEHRFVDAGYVWTCARCAAKHRLNLLPVPDMTYTDASTGKPVLVWFKTEADS